MFEAECHCGNVKISARRIPSSLTSCNCSICHRLGANWAYFDFTEVEFQSCKAPLISYSWGEKSIDFHHCSICGCATHYTATESDGNELVAINGRMAAPSLTETIPQRYFDGALSWKYLDE